MTINRRDRRCLETGGTTQNITIAVAQRAGYDAPDIMCCSIRVRERDAGSDVTPLHRTSGRRGYQPSFNLSPMIIVGPMRYNNNVTATNLTADAAQGTKSIIPA
jgi:hypothetical protein